jgi:2-phosphosulfolactate phosphatase
MSLSSIDVLISANETDDSLVRGKTTVVIDILRATSTMITALHNGAKSIFPVAGMDQAMRLTSTLDRSAVLTCGERNGLTIEGFDLGNSPLSCTPEIVTGKSMVMTTTNGTQALEKAKHAKKVYIGGFLNAARLMEELKTQGEEVLLVCSGWKGRFSLEDTLFAGYIVHELVNHSKGTPVLTDASTAALALYTHFAPKLVETLLESDHAKRLRDIVGEEEIRYCLTKDACPVLPVFHDGVITLPST